MANAKLRVPALDGLRGIAILLVMAYHYSLVLPALTPLDRAVTNVVSFGAEGVTLFFVLSGYLITGILLDAKGASGYFRTFYARRILRIFPLYYLILFVSLVVVPHLPLWKDALEAGGGIGPDAIWYWLYLSNFAIAEHPIWRHATLDVSWSLAIEEQFYLVWPAVVLFCSRRQLLAISVVLTVLALVWRIAVSFTQPTTVTIGVLTPAHLDGLALGVLIALLVRDTNGRALLARWAPRLALMVVAAVILTGAWGGGENSPLMLTWLSLLFAVALGGALGVVNNRQLVRLLEQPVLRSFGKYSYALYLFHQPVRQVVAHVIDPQRLPVILGSHLPAMIVFGLLAGGIALVAAWLSWRIYEQPLLALKRYFEYKPARARAEVQAAGVAENAGTTVRGATVALAAGSPEPA